MRISSKVWAVLFGLQVCLVVAGVTMLSMPNDKFVSSDSASAWPAVYMLIIITGILYFVFFGRNRRVAKS